jgi:hypothetical protein
LSVRARLVDWRMSVAFRICCTVLRSRWCQDGADTAPLAFISDRGLCATHNLLRSGISAIRLLDNITTNYPCPCMQRSGDELRRMGQPVEKRARSGVELRRWLLRRSRLFAREVGIGSRRASTCANFLGPLPQKSSSRFMFCPAAITSASTFTRQSSLRRKHLIPCHSLASPNMGSTHTLRSRNAFS